MSTRDSIVTLKESMGRSIIGQEKVVERLIIGLLADGNLLIEGLPALCRHFAGNARARYAGWPRDIFRGQPDVTPGRRCADHC